MCYYSCVLHILILLIERREGGYPGEGTMFITSRAYSVYHNVTLVAFPSSCSWLLLSQ